MIDVHAKPVVNGKFWIVESEGHKVGILKVTEQNKYVFSSKDTVQTFDSKKKLFEAFGKNFFTVPITQPVVKQNCEIEGYPTTKEPHNSMFDVKRHLPLFTKSEKSKSVFCAGYYLIKFNKGWTRAFCPKLVTIERYPFEGPFTTEIEMKQRLANVSRED